MNIRAKIFGGHDPSEEPLLRAKQPRGAKADQLDSVNVRRESQSRRNSRAEDRHRLVGESARITHNGTDHEVELINLSGGGAMVTGPFEPLLWDRVDLHLGEHGTIECAVRWLREGQVGLEFAHETRLDWPSDQVAIVLRHIIERTFPHIDFPQSEEPVAPPVQQEWTDEHRSAKRHPLIWSGTLHHDFQSDTVRIRNISSTGAMIETTTSVRVGSEPLLELSPTLALSTTVQWAVGDQVGLRFQTPFDMDELKETRPTVAASIGSEPGQDQWGRLSLQELRQELEGYLKR